MLVLLVAHYLIPGRISWRGREREKLRKEKEFFFIKEDRITSFRIEFAYVYTFEERERKRENFETNLFRSKDNEDGISVVGSVCGSNIYI